VPRKITQDDESEYDESEYDESEDDPLPQKVAKVVCSLTASC
jgi:hypothetical protein